MRHMDWLLDEFNLEINKANRKEVDEALRKHFGFSEKEGCPKVWEKLKDLSEEEKLELAQKLDI